MVKIKLSTPEALWRMYQNYHNKKIKLEKISFEEDKLKEMEFKIF